MKITSDDIDAIDNASPLELFYQGIRTESTKISYEIPLKHILCNVCEDLLSGTFEERAAELVERAKTDPDWVLKLALSMVIGWKEKTELDPSDPEYVNPSSLKQYMCPVKKLLDMNEVMLPWKRIYGIYPDLERNGNARGWFREEIQALLAHTTSVKMRAVILMLASSGVRAGGLVLKWGDVNPVYRVDGKLVDGKDAEKLRVTGNPVCASVCVYQGSSEEYVTFLTPEAYDALMEHAAKYEEEIGRALMPDDPIFKKAQNHDTPVDSRTVANWITPLAWKSGVRETHTKKSRRYNVPIVHGFRRFWNKTYLDNRIGDMPMSSIIKKEYMLGHCGVMPLDRNYYQTHPMELAEEYLHVVDVLTISEEERLRIANKQKDEKILELEAQNDASMREMQKRSDERMDRLENIIQVMAKRLDSLNG